MSDAFGFWVVAISAALAVAGLLMRTLVSTSRRDTTSGPEFEFYREQLATVARDAAAGKISPDEAEQLELEIKRRILEADRAAQSEASETQPPEWLTMAVVLGIVAVLLLGSIGLYTQIGTPGYRDMPIKARLETAARYRQERPSQREIVEQIASHSPASPDIDSSPEYLELMQKLRATVAERPDDLKGHELLLQNEARLGNYSAAAEAAQSVVRLKGEAVQSGDFLQLAQLWIAAAQGYVSPEAEVALRKALELDENNLTARYYWGLMYAQTGRPDIAFRVWRPLVANPPENAPWIADLRQQILITAQDAGVQYSLPPESNSPRGPSREDIEAAENMSPEDRQQLIESMVTSLATRLAEQGGTAQDWARLIRSLGVLNDNEKAQMVSGEAREIFGSDPESLSLIEAAEKAAGIVP